MVRRGIYAPVGQLLCSTAAPFWEGPARHGRVRNRPSQKMILPQLPGRRVGFGLMWDKRFPEVGVRSSTLFRERPARRCGPRSQPSRKMSYRQLPGRQVGFGQMWDKRFPEVGVRSSTLFREGHARPCGRRNRPSRKMYRSTTSRFFEKIKIRSACGGDCETARRLPLVADAQASEQQRIRGQSTRDAEIKSRGTQPETPPC